MRFVLGLLIVAACQPAAETPDARQKDAPADAAPPPWWTPSTGEVDHWDIQLAAPFAFDQRANKAFVVNLWDVVAADTVLDYGDGAPITVPAGIVKGKLEFMHAMRPRTQVICRIDTGALKLTDPDASKFPGFAATPPDDPALPEAGSVIGWSATLPAGLRWLDVRSAARPTVLPLLKKRFELAKQIGCDAVLPDHNNMYSVKRAGGLGAEGEGTGFSPPLEFNGMVEWYVALAKEAHALELSVGYRGPINATSDDVLANFDWGFADSCGEEVDCMSWQVWQRSAYGDKAVLALDYDRRCCMPERGAGQYCNEQKTNGIIDGIIKDVALTSTTWLECPNPDPISGIDASLR